MNIIGGHVGIQAVRFGGYTDIHAYLLTDLPQYHDAYMAD